MDTFGEPLRHAEQNQATKFMVKPRLEAPIAL